MAVTTIAVLGNLGVLTSAEPPGLAVANAETDSNTREPAADPTAAVDAGDAGNAATEDRKGRKRDRADRRNADRSGGSRSSDAEAPAREDPADVVPLPADSGEGHRIVFSESLQRIWLVDDEDEVVRTYLGSGSVYDNLEPGTYAVYSRSRHAVGIDNSGTMEYFVRFTQGDEGAAIGFHSIPVDDGEPVQTRKQLGTPLSHGCIRQAKRDAIALWRFAPIGTTVVVTA